MDSTYFDIGFTLASTLARTLQYLMFSGNSWIPREKMQKKKRKCEEVEQLHKINSTSALNLKRFITSDTKQMTPVKTNKDEG